MNTSHDKMAENSTFVQETGANESLDDMDLQDFATTFASKHMFGTLIVFCGTILLIVGGAICCWCRYFRRDSNQGIGLNSTNEPLYDGANRRDTLVLNLRRQSRRDTLSVLPFIRNPSIY